MLTTKWRLGLAISLLLAPAAAIIQGDRATAVEQNGTYVVISPDRQAPGLLAQVDFTTA